MEAGQDAREGSAGSVPSPLSTLDANLVACVFMHLDPPTLAQVSQACRALSQESESDVVWCALFLRRFGSDLWGERAGPHPYHSVPKAVNEWSELSPSEAFARFSQRLATASATELVVEKDDVYVRTAQAIESALSDYVNQHGAKEGYGGWKAAFLTMEEMVKNWRMPVSTGYLIAGLPDFSVLSRIADVVVNIATSGALNDESQLGQVQADVTSPAGECRVIRFIYYADTTWGDLVEHTTNLCVLRKPREWYRCGGGKHFRGLHFNENSTMDGLRLIYVIDGSKIESGDDDYQEYVYRELHGLIGEGKGHYRKGLPIQLCIINSAAPVKILHRLKISPLRNPTHMCAYYAGPVLFVINLFVVASDEETEAQAQHRTWQLGRGLSWMSKQPSERPHWALGGLRLGTLQANSS